MPDVTDQRPPVAVGHVHLNVGDVAPRHAGSRRAASPSKGSAIQRLGPLMLVR